VAPERGGPGTGKRPLGVAFLVHSFDTPGGMEGQAARLADHLADRGVRVTVITTYFPRGFGLPLPRHPRSHEKLRPGVEVVRVPMFPWWSTNRCLRLLETVATYVVARRLARIDAIYAVHYWSGRHATAVARVVECPTVVKFACGGEYGDFHQIGDLPHKELVLEELARIDRYACISDEVREEVVAAGLDARRCVSIPNGVVRGRFEVPVEPAPLPELGPVEGRQVVLFVGRHDSQKRVDVLLRAFVEISRRVPGARLACAGQGPAEAELRALARTLGLDGKVAFLGTRGDIPALHRAASVFVLPSVAEGMSNALLEALASGTPAVATDIASNRELVRHEREGLLVPREDPVALAAAVVRLLEDRELARRLAEAGRARVASEFDMGLVADRYLDLFRELARARRPRSVTALALMQLKLAAATISLGILLAGSLFRQTVLRGVTATKKRLGIEHTLLPSLFGGRAVENAAR